MFWEAVMRCRRLMPDLSRQMIPQRPCSQYSHAAAHTTHQSLLQAAHSGGFILKPLRREEELLTCRLLNVIEEVEQTEEELVPSTHDKQHRLQESKHSAISSTGRYIYRDSMYDCVCVCVCVFFTLDEIGRASCRERV